MTLRTLALAAVILAVMMIQLELTNGSPLGKEASKHDDRNDDDEAGDDAAATTPEPKSSKDDKHDRDDDDDDEANADDNDHGHHDDDDNDEKKDEDKDEDKDDEQPEKQDDKRGKRGRKNRIFDLPSNWVAPSNAGFPPMRNTWSGQSHRQAHPSWGNPAIDATATDYFMAKQYPTDIWDNIGR